MLYTVLFFIRAPFYILLVFVCMCSVFKLLWLSRHYLPSDWLGRLLWGSLTVARGSLNKAQAEECLIVLVYCILSLFNCMIFLYCPALRDILFTSMTQYSVFVLKVPLNAKQTNKQYHQMRIFNFKFFKIYFCYYCRLCQNVSSYHHCDKTRYSAIADKPRDAFVQLQWRLWPVKSRPSPYVLYIYSFKVIFIMWTSLVLYTNVMWTRPAYWDSHLHMWTMCADIVWSRSTKLSTITKRGEEKLCYGIANSQLWG